MTAPSVSPPVGSVAGELAAALELAGYLPIGAPVRLLGGDPARTWTVAGLTVDLYDAANLNVHYRLWCVAPFDYQTVPAALAQPIGPGAPPPVPAPATALDPADPIDPGPLAWVAPVAGVERTRCGRFEIDHPDGPAGCPRARDLWTGETAAHVYSRAGARHWCRHRAHAPALRWEPATGDAGPHERAVAPCGAAFKVYQETDSAGRPLQEWFAVDGRFEAHPWRFSPDFRTAAAARAWCEVRAACAARPALVETDPNARDEWGGPLVFQYASDVAPEIPF